MKLISLCAITVATLAEVQKPQKIHPKDIKPPPSIDIDSEIEKLLSESYTSLSPMINRLSGKLDQVFQQIQPYIKGMIRVENGCFRSETFGEFTDGDIDEGVSCLLDSFFDPEIIFKRRFVQQEERDEL